MKIKNATVKNLKVTAAVLPTGLTSSDPSTSAWQIKQDYPASPDGVYWIQNVNINGGDPVEIYADMTTLGGGWTLIMQNNNTADWDFASCLLKNPTAPPADPDNTPRQSNNNYSIIAWADSIKRSASGFDYMLDAGTRGRMGGAWTANEAYSFTAQWPGSGAEPIGDYQYQTAGWRKNITEIAHFPAGNPGSSATWIYDASGLEARMPYYGKNINDAPGANSYTPHAGSGLITTNGQDGAWWGTLITPGGWNPAPWMGGGEVGDGQWQSPFSAGWPGIIWYWVR